MAEPSIEAASSSFAFLEVLRAEAPSSPGVFPRTAKRPRPPSPRPGPPGLEKSWRRDAGPQPYGACVSRRCAQIRRRQRPHDRGGRPLELVRRHHQSPAPRSLAAPGTEAPPTRGPIPRRAPGAAATLPCHGLPEFPGAIPKVNRVWSVALARTADVAREQISTPWCGRRDPRPVGCAASRRGHDPGTCRGRGTTQGGRRGRRGHCGRECCDRSEGGELSQGHDRTERC